MSNFADVKPIIVQFPEKKQLFFEKIQERFTAAGDRPLKGGDVSKCKAQSYRLTQRQAAVSGISLVDSINFLLITLFSSLATGGAVIASQYIGRGDHKSASLAAKQLFYASLALSAVLGVIAVFFRKPVLNMVFGSIEADVMAHAQIYFLLSAISYPFLAVYNAGAALFRSMGDSRTTMLISILMNTINIVGNAILIYGFQMAAAGAATASLVSRAVGAIIITVLLLNPRRIIFMISSISRKSTSPC